MNNNSFDLPYSLFADLLEYPASKIVEQAQECFSQLKRVHPEAAAMLEKFANSMEQLPLQRMQELYTITFDMQPLCYPYVGYHLFGESYKRGALMAQLNEAYHSLSYSAGRELPDHLAVILRFIGLNTNNRQGDFCQALINDGVMPALEKMLKVFNAESENPYLGLLSALHLSLAHNPEKEFTHA